MDIIRELWRDFIDRSGATLREDLVQRYGFKITPENAKTVYTLGQDTGLIRLKLGEWTTVGEIITDYSEPCLKYKLYDTVRNKD